MNRKKRKKDYMKAFTVNIPAKHLDVLDEEAFDRGRSTGFIIREAVDLYLSKGQRSRRRKR